MGHDIHQSVVAFLEPVPYGIGGSGVFLVTCNFVTAQTLPYCILAIAITAIATGHHAGVCHLWLTRRNQ